MSSDLAMFGIPNQNYYRVGDASKYTGLSRNTIRKYTDQGLIKAKRLPGGDRIYHKNWLEEFMENLPDAVEAWKN